MTKPQEYSENAETGAHGHRAHARRKLAPMAYVELGQDNGGILLNLSEGGFAVQSALTLTSREFSQLRFQVPAFQGWLTASGRVVWISDSKKEAGIQFTELPGEARREIYKWVAADGEQETTRERIPVPSAARREPSRQIFETPYRGGGDAREAVLAHKTPANVAQAEQVRTTPNETVTAAVAEPPPQDFRFTEYSMFAAEPEKVGVWTEPLPRRGNWGAIALLGILMAALFFALGATVGQGNIERWIASVTGWTRNQPAATPVTPPAPQEQVQGGGTVGDKEEKSVADGSPAKVEEGANPGTGMAGGSQNALMAEKKNSERQGGKAEVGSDGAATDGTPASIAKKAAGRGKTQHFAEGAMPRNDIEPSAIATEHSILVNAPAPGSHPFYVNLPGEAVSASAAIAISARRTLEILPSTYGSSERVIIGKLISHSEPFYPVEARNRHIEGSVELRARVGRTGEIVGVTPVSGPGLLMSAAATAIREWRYEPTFVNGDPAETLADITVVFRLP